MSPSIRIALSFAFVAALFPNFARAIILSDPAATIFTNTTAPTGAYSGSGWDYQGLWGSFLGTPIGPNHFLTARHVQGTIGDTFIYRGTSYVTDDYVDAPNSDLRIWHVISSFPDYAPVYLKPVNVGQELVIFGRGTDRGAPVATSAGGAGWLWGATNQTQRWGTNRVSATSDRLLIAEFNFGTSDPYEAHLSVGDSGGGVFIKDDDEIWKLAAVNYSVSDAYSSEPNGTERFNAALYDQAGFFEELSSTPLSGPGELYLSRIDAHAEFIEDVVGVPEPAVGILALSAAACFAGRRLRS
jgi:hypothetical protein